MGEACAYCDVVFNLPLPGALTYRVEAAHSHCAVGSRVVAPVGRRSLTGFVVAVHDTAPVKLASVKAISRFVDKEPLFDVEYISLAQWISEMYLCSLGEALATMAPTGRSERELPRIGGDDETLSPVPVTLSQAQHRAVTRLVGSGQQMFYLYGKTGSGKTEVFLHVAERVIAGGCGVIYLVPEITLTHQLVDSIRVRFGEQIAVLHSGLTPSQRLTEWRRIRAGEANLVVGARSAVFAPVRKLGLVVLDEEHEGSYKSGSTPRYHARQVAMKRCAAAGARLVMGSATPSVEAWHLMRVGRFERLVLTERLSGGAAPQVETVDLSGTAGGLSRELIEEIRATHRAGRQSILFLNRRGFSYFFHCRSCGFEMHCARCAVSLTYHKHRDAMVCHYCGYSTRPVQVCPECGSLDVGYSGFGTQKLEEDLAREFPELRISRLDTDAVRKKGVLSETLRAFRNGETDMLLGTQMVAKGLNFPGVRLVGIVMADTGLQLPDFRAAERTFALIVQVAGRAGRFAPDGRVVVQTFRPHHDAIRDAARGEVESFYARELEIRKELGFPPFSRLIRVVVRGKNLGRVRAVADRLGAALREQAGAQTSAPLEVLGPAECPIGMIASRHRVHVLVRSTVFAELHAAMSSALRSIKLPHGVYLEPDVDPVQLM